MARPGITYDEVIAAIDAILAAGEEPTIQRIREHLGTGSPNTIHRHLIAWRQSRPVEQRRAPELPAELQAALVKEIETASGRCPRRRLKIPRRGTKRGRDTLQSW